jgi:MFS family permease
MNKEEPEYMNDIASIRSMMERSNKFISLSGMSGVMAGLYALAGSVVAYMLIYYPNTPFGYRFAYVSELQTLFYLFITAAAVLVFALATGLLLTKRKAAKTGQKVLGKNAVRLIINVFIPLTAGGVFILLLVFRGYYGIVAPASLLFYGLALLNASNYTLTDIRYLGFCEIVLGLLCAILPGYGLIFWAIGFGVLHIVYGIVMHNKYDK